MIPMDYTVKAGHKIGVILYGTDTQATERPFVKTKGKIEGSSINVEIPFV